MGSKGCRFSRTEKHDSLCSRWAVRHCLKYQSSEPSPLSSLPVHVSLTQPGSRISLSEKSSRRADERKSSPRGVLAAPPAGPLCPAWGSRASFPPAAACAGNPSPGPVRAPGRRVSAGNSSAQSCRQRSCVPARLEQEPDLSKLRTPLLSGSSPGRHWGQAG